MADRLDMWQTEGNGDLKARDAPAKRGNLDFEASETTMRTYSLRFEYQMEAIYTCKT